MTEKCKKSRQRQEASKQIQDIKPWKQMRVREVKIYPLYLDKQEKAEIVD